MDRRDFAKKAAALGLAPIVVSPGEWCVPRTNRKARLVWIGLCHPVSVSKDRSYLPSVDDYCAQQVLAGRQILATIQRADDSSLVAVGEDYPSEAAAREAMRNVVRRICEPDADKRYDYGLVWAIAHIGPGEAFDVLGFLQSKEERSHRGLEVRLSRLECESRKARGTA